MVPQTGHSVNDHSPVLKVRSLLDSRCLLFLSLVWRFSSSQSIFPKSPDTQLVHSRTSHYNVYHSAFFPARTECPAASQLVRSQSCLHRPSHPYHSHSDQPSDSYPHHAEFQQPRCPLRIHPDHHRRCRCNISRYTHRRDFPNQRPIL